MWHTKCFYNKIEIFQNEQLNKESNVWRRLNGKICSNAFTNETVTMETNAEKKKKKERDRIFDWYRIDGKLRGKEWWSGKSFRICWMIIIFKFSNHSSIHPFILLRPLHPIIPLCRYPILKWGKKKTRRIHNKIGYCYYYLLILFYFFFQNEMFVVVGCCIFYYYCCYFVWLMVCHLCVQFFIYYVCGIICLQI